MTTVHLRIQGPWSPGHPGCWGKTPILSQFGAQAPPLGSKLRWASWLKSWIRRCSGGQKNIFTRGFYCPSQIFHFVRKIFWLEIKINNGWFTLKEASAESDLEITCAFIRGLSQNWFNELNFWTELSHWRDMGELRRRMAPNAFLWYYVQDKVHCIVLKYEEQRSVLGNRIREIISFHWKFFPKKPAYFFVG